MSKQSVNLHTIPAFQEINVREGVKLRPLDTSDASRILEILALDKTIRESVSVASRIFTIKDVMTEVEKYRQNKGLLRYTILENDNPVGLVSFWQDYGFWGKPHLNDYGFGYFLDKNRRGKGLVSSAVKSLIDISLQNLQVRQFIAFCEDSNLESVAVLTKLGFEPTNKT